MNGVEKVNSYRRMIAGLAWRAWVTLPRQHQIWIGLDDMIEDGMFKAYQVISSKWYDPNKSSISTTIYHSVQNYFQNEYIKQYGNEKRFASLESAGIVDYDTKHRRKKQKQHGLTPAGLISLDALVELPKVQQEIILEAPQMSTSEESIYNAVLTDCFVVPVLVKIYTEASHRLKEEMFHWFLQNKGKIHIDGKKFRRAAREFRSLSNDFDLNYYDCLHLVQSPSCMWELTREIRAIRNA